MDPALMKQLLLGVVPPVVVGGFFFLACLWTQRAQRWDGEPALASVGVQPRQRQWRVWYELLGLLLVGACVLGLYPRIFGTIQAFPGTSSEGALFHVVLMAVGLGAVWALGQHLTRGARLRWWMLLGGLATALVLAGACVITFRRHLFSQWSNAFSLGMLAWVIAMGLSLALGLRWLGTRGDTARSRGGGIAGVISAVVATGAAAQVMVVNLASIKHAQGAGIWAAFLTPAALLVLLRPGLVLPSGVCVACGVVLSVQLAQASVFGDGRLPWLFASAVAMAPWLGALVLHVTRQRGGGWPIILCVLATAALGVASVGVGAWWMLQESDGQASSEYEY